MRHIFIISLWLLLFISSATAREVDPKQNPKAVQAELISMDQLKQLLAKNTATIVDVRTPQEYASGHLPDARNINFFGPRFETDILKLPKDEPVILYCASGRRSEAAAEFLAKAGYAKVMSLDKGINGWRKTGGKIIKDLPK